jgi:hypothetical protein
MTVARMQLGSSSRFGLCPADLREEDRPPDALIAPPQTWQQGRAPVSLIWERFTESHARSFHKGVAEVRQPPVFLPTLPSAHR